MRKLRGHKRLHRQIQKWRAAYMQINIPEALLSNDRYYVKIRVHPYSGITYANSLVPEPAGETRQKMLNALLDIYDAWKAQLSGYSQPYYLKLWLFDPRFSHSQVVCAVGDGIPWYENSFFKPKAGKPWSPVGYGAVAKRLAAYNWTYHLDEDHYDNSEPGWPSLKLLKKPHRTVPFKEAIDDATESYSFKRGDVWLGEKK